MSTDPPRYVRSRLAFLSLSLGLCVLPTSTWAQHRWKRLPLPTPVARHAVTYDLARSEILLFGGQWSTYVLHESDDFWAFSGGEWRFLDEFSSAGTRYDTALAYDAGRDRTVVFGGRAGSSSNSTLEWDGGSWTFASPIDRPSRRHGHTMVYDAARGHVVLFGGRDATGAYLGETWTWDGTNWQRLTPLTSPPVRAFHGMTYDTQRQRAIVFGGTSGTGALQDVWEWDGATWHASSATPSTSIPDPPELAYDASRQVTVMQRGAETWEWNGASWTRIQASVPSRQHGTLIYDPALAKVVRIGGYDGTTYYADVWTFDGLQWEEIGPPTSHEAHRTQRVAYDHARNRTVVRSTSSQEDYVLEFDGTEWERVDVPLFFSRPAEMAPNAGGQGVMAFGGYGPFDRGTHLWDGTSWTTLTPTVEPGQRVNHDMVWDRRRDRVVLFGGFFPGPGQLGDTWEWDGATWSQRNPPNAPSPREFVSMVWDPRSERVLLFGGRTGRQEHDDLWAWDGNDWTLLVQAGDVPRSGPCDMVYDSVLGRVLLRHLSSTFPGRDVWAWDGTTWMLHALNNTDPVPRGNWHWVHDPRIGRTLAFVDHGGDVWEFGVEHPASYEVIGPGCDGSSGPVTLRPAVGSNAWIGEVVDLELSNLPATSLVAPILFLGLSRTSWAGLSLPLDLGLLGMPGCPLHVSPDIPFPTLRSMNSARQSLFVPADPVAIGVDIHFQGLVLDPLANAAGLVTSEAGTTRIGSR